MRLLRSLLIAAVLVTAPLALSAEEEGEPFDPATLGTEPVPPDASFSDYDHLVPDTPENGVSWDLLGATGEKVEIVDGFSHLRPVFSEEVRELDGKRIRMKGFMYPMQQSGNQDVFLFTALPPSCPYCLPAGPGYIIEAEATKPVRFTWDAILVEGRLELMDDHEYGLFFRLSEVERLN